MAALVAGGSSPPLLSAQATTRPSADAIMTRASRTWQTLSSFQADFRMKLDDPVIDHEESRGRLYQSGANRFAMRFTEPANSAIVIDGTWLWVYLPENDPRNVNKMPAPAGATYGYNHLAWLFDRPNEKYRATWLREEPIDGRVTDVLLLEPVTAGMPFRRATVWIDRESVLPRKLELDEKLLVRTLTLSRIRTNSSLPPAIFTFRVPDGVRVIEQ
jgi:outer membrane lipoprotein-sorting protein